MKRRVELWATSSGFVSTRNTSEMCQLGVWVIKQEEVWAGEMARELRVLVTRADVSHDPGGSQPL